MILSVLLLHCVKNPMALSSMIAPMNTHKAATKKITWLVTTRLHVDEVAGHTLFFSHCFLFCFITSVYTFLMSLTEPIEHSLDDQHLKMKDSQQEISCYHIGKHF